MLPGPLVAGEALGDEWRRYVRLLGWSVQLWWWDPPRPSSLELAGLEVMAAPLVWSLGCIWGTKSSADSSCSVTKNTYLCCFKPLILWCWLLSVYPNTIYLQMTEFSFCKIHMLSWQDHIHHLSSFCLKILQLLLGTVVSDLAVTCQREQLSTATSPPLLDFSDIGLPARTSSGDAVLSKKTLCSDFTC